MVGGALLLFMSVGGPGAVSDEWAEFKVPQNDLVDQAASADRFASANGSDRYQLWTIAIDAGKSDPLTGIGPGQYESYWAQNGTEPTFVRDAHSLYLETFAGLGLVGLLLVLGLLLVPVAWSVWSSRFGSCAGDGCSQQPLPRWSPSCSLLGSTGPGS